MSRLEEIKHKVETWEDELILNRAESEYLLSLVKKQREALENIAFGRIEGDYSDVKYYAREALEGE